MGAVESCGLARIINLVWFVDAESIDPIYVERPYHLAPDGEVAGEAFAVVREAIRAKAGIGKLVLYGREHLAAVQARARGLVMFTLRHVNEILSMEAIDELERLPAKVKPDEVKLARQVIGTFEGQLDLSAYQDEYQEELNKIINAKITGEEIMAPAEEPPAKVVNLMAALRKSLDAVSATKGTTAKAELPRPAAARPPRKRQRA